MSASTPCRFSRRAAAFAVAGLVAASLSGCGRRGGLEAPDAAAVQAPASDDLSVRRPSQKIAPPKKDFVLDPLLK